MIRICRLVLKPGEEVKGVMLDVEYFPLNSSTEAHPALQVRTRSVLHPGCIFIVQYTGMHRIPMRSPHVHLHTIQVHTLAMASH